MTFVAFVTGRQELLTAGKDNTIRLWDLGHGKEIRRFAGRSRSPPNRRRRRTKAKPPAEVFMQMMTGGQDGGRFPASR